jgi:hypothetical protein
MRPISRRYSRIGGCAIKGKTLPTSRARLLAIDCAITEIKEKKEKAPAGASQGDDY